MTRRSRAIPDATVERLPGYRRALLGLDDEGIGTVSSERLAELSGVNAAKVRKDLSYLGSYGTRGVGYDVAFLLFQVSRELGLTSRWPVIIVGLGNLGQALAKYSGFSQRGFPVVALVDIDPKKVGSVIDNITISSLESLPELVKELGITTGIIATPGEAAQDVANRLVDAGILSILNFGATSIVVPDAVPLREVDLATELQILSFYQNNMTRSEADSA